VVTALTHSAAPTAPPLARTAPALAAAAAAAMAAPETSDEALPVAAMATRLAARPAPPLAPKAPALAATAAAWGQMVHWDPENSPQGALFRFVGFV